MSLFRSRRHEPPAMTLEGLLGPNSRLDEADAIDVEEPDALCVAPDGRLLFSAGRHVLASAAWGDAPVPHAAFERRVTGLCASHGGLLAVAMEGGCLAVTDAAGRLLDGWRLPEGRLASVVDCVFRSEDELLLVDSGYSDAGVPLARATWDDRARGQLVSLRPSGESRVLAAGLHAPMGVCLDDRGTALVSLLERAAVVDEAGAVRRAGYPGYLGRLRRAGNEFLLACLSRRDPLIEFLKTETAFVTDMKATIDPSHWIAPRVSPEFRHDVPIELGATRLFGEVKPWAPSFSYGLLIGLDAALAPVGSAQSRANGRRHAICDVVRWRDDLIAVSKGSGEILRLPGGLRP